MQEKDTETFCPGSAQEWRKWLLANHRHKESVWLILYKKATNVPTVNWSDAVDQALCFGWIDGKRKTLDEERFIQFYSKRKPRGTWSKINKEKIERLTEEGLMTKAGIEVIERAKQNGSWMILDEAEEMVIPQDLDKELKKHKEAEDFFMNLSRSVRKAMLQWLVLAKREETRQKRITEIVTLALEGKRPKQF